MASCIRQRYMTFLAKIILAIGVNQPAQERDLLLQFAAAFGIRHSPRSIPTANGLDAGDNVHSVAKRRFDRFKVMVPGEHGSICLENEGETMVPVGFGKSAVDRDRFATA